MADDFSSSGAVGVGNGRRFWRELGCKDLAGNPCVMYRQEDLAGKTNSTDRSPNNPSTDLDDHDVRDAATTSQQQQKQRQSLLLHRLTHHCHLQRCPTTIYRKLSRLARRTTRRTDLTTRLHSISFQCRMDHTTNCRVLQFHSKRKDFWQYQQ